jgi:uncharacterized protein (DUF1330 family)
MTAYVIVQAEITDWDRFNAYLRETSQTIAQHGEKYIAHGGEMAVLEGNDQVKRIYELGFALFPAAAFLFSHAFFMAKLIAFFCACVLFITFAPAAGALAAAAGFAACAFLFAQYSRILCAWALRSAGVRFRPLLLAADGTGLVCRITAPMLFNSFRSVSISSSTPALCR